MTKGINLTGEQIEAWAGGPLSDEQVDRLAECIPHSSIPDAVETIVTEAMGVQFSESNQG